MIKIFYALIVCIMLIPATLFAGTVQLPKTGQTSSYASGDDGALQKGATWPEPRFTNNGNGTVTDNLTGLIWLQNANCRDTAGGISRAIFGDLTWADALTWSNSLASGACGLTDGSVAGNWRLPNRKELKSLVNRQQSNSATWLNSSGFSNVFSSDYYWTSSTDASYPSKGWIVHMGNGCDYVHFKSQTYYVLPVRGGQYCYPTVKVNGIYYDTIQNAYDSSISDDEIQIQSSPAFTENVLLNREITISLKGGYDCQYSTNSGYSTINGKLTVNKGKVTVDKLIIK